MAKVKSAGLRNYVGRLAGSVYYVVKGENVAREVAPKVTNPKTQPQMMQRVRLANLVNFYRVNKEWMKKYAFETLTGLKTIYNEFVSKNLTNRSVPLTKQNAAEGAVAPDFLNVTKGSLPSIGSATEFQYDYAAYFPLSGVGDNSNWGVLSKALIDNDGFKDGDQLSVIGIKYLTGKPCVVVAKEHIIDSTSTEGIPIYLAEKGSTLRVDLSEMLDIADAIGFSICLIHSRRENGKVLVSSEVLSLSPNALTAQRAATSKRAFELAIDSYGYTDEPFLDPAQNALSEKYTISVVESDEGTITGAGSYDYGTEVTIKATANPEFTFVGWAAPFSDKPNPFTLQVTEDITIKANFAQTE